MEIKTTVTGIKDWIRGNKWSWAIIAIFLMAAVAGTAFYIGAHRKAAPEYISQFPVAAISADVSYGRVEDIFKDINRERSQAEEVVANAKKKAVKAIADLDNDAVAAAWNARIGEYREQRKNKDIGAGSEPN